MLILYTCVCVSFCVCVCTHSIVQSCLILCNPMNCSPWGSSVHGIFQAWILEWIAISYSRGSSRDWTLISCISGIGRQILYHRVTWKLIHTCHSSNPFIFSSPLSPTSVSTGKAKNLALKMGRNCQGKHIDWNRPRWPGTIVTVCMSCFTTSLAGGPAKEHGTNKQSPTGRVQEGSKGDITCLTTSQNPSLWSPSWLNKVCTTRKDPESEWLAKDNPETNPVTIKPETASQWQSGSPGFPYLPAFHPGALSQKNLLFPQHMCLLRQFISEC